MEIEKTELKKKKNNKKIYLRVLKYIDNQMKILRDMDKNLPKI
jgi:hypothetical protein